MHATPLGSEKASRSQLKPTSQESGHSAIKNFCLVNETKILLSDPLLGDRPPPHLGEFGTRLRLLRVVDLLLARPASSISKIPSAGSYTLGIYRLLVQQSDTSAGFPSKQRRSSSLVCPQVDKNRLDVQRGHELNLSQIAQVQGRFNEKDSARANTRFSIQSSQTVKHICDEDGRSYNLSRYDSQVNLNQASHAVALHNTKVFLGSFDPSLTSTTNPPGHHSAQRGHTIRTDLTFDDMAATVAQPPAPAALSSSRSVNAPAASGSHVAHDQRHHRHNHFQPQAAPTNCPRVGALPKTQKFNPDHFKVVRTLGTGTFARVCLVRPSNASDIPLEQENRGNAEVYALKILRKTEVIRLKQVDHVRHERSILADVAGHPFITSLLASFSDHDCLYMLLDYVPGGELFSYLRKLRRFEESTACFYAAEIVLVLEYLHEHQGGVAYRDLKPENLLLDKDGHIKLVDFGFAKRLGYKDDRPVETYTLCGTPEYLAPEVIQNKGHTTAVDWWALGILIYEFLTGYPPFWHQNPIEIYKQIIGKPLTFPQDPPISEHAKDIVRSFCTVDRSRRLGNLSGGASRVRAHPFFQSINWDDLLSRRRQGPIVPPVRYPGDAQCFETYSEEDGKRDVYTSDMAQKYDQYFADF
ncbi:hypothetical protein E4U28_007082 [Claviceps purpurea]|nr:hypothetical protein E4U28_007082 [Claviceps purpurea]